RQSRGDLGVSAQLAERDRGTFHGRIVQSGQVERVAGNRLRNELGQLPALHEQQLARHSLGRLVVRQHRTSGERGGDGQRTEHGQNSFHVSLQKFSRVGSYAVRDHQRFGSVSP